MTDLEIARLNYVRVSTIIGKQTAEDMALIPPAVLENAGYRGTKVHNYCTAYVKGLWLPEMEKEYEPYVEAFINWYDVNVSRTLHTNTRLYDDEKKITGEFDMIVKLKENNRIAMLDLKTSANVSRSWPVQLAAYKHLCELNGFHPEIYYNIHLKKTKSATYELVEGIKTMVTPPKIKCMEIPHEDLKPSWEIFSSALNCYNFFNRNEVS